MPRTAPRILQAVGEGLAWDVGALWTVDPPAHVMRCVIYSYDAVWWLSILFGLLSAVINLPIVEKPVARGAVAPA